MLSKVTKQDIDKFAKGLLHEFLGELIDVTGRQSKAPDENGESNL